MNTRTKVLGVLWIGSVLGTLPACSLFADKGPTIEQAASYTGPPVEFDSSGRTHIARITCPTGGWSVRHDLTREGWPHHEVFVTLVSPPVGVMVTQALTELLVDTRAPAGAGCRLYIRRAEEAPDRLSAGAYRLAATAEPAG